MKKILLFILVFALTVPFFASCGAMSDDAPAIKAGETEVSLREFRYRYNNNIEGFKSVYGERLESAKKVDFSKPLTTQPYINDNTISWADYFADYTVRALKNFCLFAEDARVNGITLSADDIKMVDDQMEIVKSQIEKTGLSPEEFFGNGITLDMYRSYLERNLLGNNRYYSELAAVEISYDECLEYAKENTDKFYTVNYYSYKFKASDYNVSYKEATDAANKFVSSVTNINEFEKILVDTVLSDDEKAAYTEGKYFVSNKYKSVLDEDLQVWAFDANRKAGDFITVTDTEGVVVYMFAGLELPSYPSYNYRCIFISKDNKSVDASDIVAEWENGGKGEDLFASLASEYSDDAESALNGGLMENTMFSGLGNGFYAWTTSTERAYGDVSTFTGEDGSYILFYVSEGAPIWQSQAISELEAIKFNAYIDELAEKYGFTANENVIKRVKK